MSIVNSITYSQRRRDKMINYRNGFTYIASVFILVLALILFISVSKSVLQFRILACIAVGTGCCTSFFYICTIHENKLGRLALELESKFKNRPIDSTGMALVDDSQGKRAGKTWK